MKLMSNRLPKIKLSGLSPTSGYNQKNPPHHTPFSFPTTPSTSHSVSQCGGHFTLEPSPLKPDDAHLTFASVPSILNTILSHGPHRTSPWTAKESPTNRPIVCTDPPSLRAMASHYWLPSTSCPSPCSHHHVPSPPWCHPPQHSTK